MQSKNLQIASLAISAAICFSFSNSFAVEKHVVKIAIDGSTIGKVNAKINGKMLSTTPQLFSFNAATKVVSAAVYGKRQGAPANINVNFSLLSQKNQKNRDSYTIFFTGNYLICGAYVSQTDNCTPCQANGWNPPYYTICTVKTSVG